jgi:acetyltransferase
VYKRQDVEALAEVLVRVGHLVAQETAVRELDLNPVVAGPQGCWAVDARVVLGAAAHTS